MGWKTRKDKLTSDPSQAGVQDSPDEIVAPEMTAAGSEPGSHEPARAPYSLDPDRDAFGTSTRHTSLDPAAFSWYQTAPINAPDEPEEAPPAQPPAFQPPAFQAPAPFAPREPTAGAFDDFGTKPYAFSPITKPVGADPIEPSPEQWDLQSATRSAPVSNAVPEYGEPYAAPGKFQPEAQPAFSEPGSAASWDFVEPNLGPSISNPVPSIEQLMAPQNHVPPTPLQAPPAPAAPTREPVPPVPDSFRPTFLQTQGPPQQSNYSQQGQTTRRGREDVASGLVLQDNELGIPKVAPFILNMGSSAEVSDPVEQPTLVIRFKNLAARYTITKAVTTLGRPDSETGNYPDVEIDLDEGVSRKHAEIRLRGGRYCLIDLGSTNGTLLNGQAVIALTENILTHGDRIRIGEMTEIVFE